MYTNLSLAALSPPGQSACGSDYSRDHSVVNYKYICDGLLVSIIGCIGVMGRNSDPGQTNKLCTVQ